jgi:hypothetical protein
MVVNRLIVPFDLGPSRARNPSELIKSLIRERFALLEIRNSAGYGERHEH